MSISFAMRCAATLLFVGTLLHGSQYVVFGAEQSIRVELLPRPSSGASEYFSIQLVGEGSLNISGWYVKDLLASPSVVFTFPSGTELFAGQAVRVCQGTLSAQPIFPCSYNFGGTAKWNNTGDTLTLYTSSDEVVLALAYDNSIEENEVVSETVLVSGQVVEEEGDNEASGEEEVVDDSEAPSDTDESSDEQEGETADSGESGGGEENSSSDEIESNEPEQEIIEEETAEENEETDVESDIEDVNESEQEGTNPVEEIIADSAGVVMICKAVNSHTEPFVKQYVPLSSVVMRRGVNDADIVPPIRHWPGRNLSERYQFNEGVFSGQLILLRHCQVSRPQPYRVVSYERYRVR